MRWFLCLCFGCVTYLALIYFYGNSGVYALNSLLDYHKRLEVHIAQLEQIQDLLEEELASLYYSEEDLKLQARKLGYFDPNDFVLYFSLPLGKEVFYRENSIPLSRNPYRLFSNSFFYTATLFAMFTFYVSWGAFAQLLKSTLKIKPLWNYLRRIGKKLSQKIKLKIKP